MLYTVCTQYSSPFTVYGVLYISLLKECVLIIERMRDDFDLSSLKYFACELLVISAPPPPGSLWGGGGVDRFPLYDEVGGGVIYLAVVAAVAACEKLFHKLSS